MKSLLFLLLLAAGASSAAPRVPVSDAEVLERLPARAADPAARELRSLRAALAARPDDAALAVQLAQRYYDQVAAEGDPRFVGYAQAALAPWWGLAAPPVEVRVMRAVLRQFSHEFDAARADLEAAVQAEPDNGAAWSWLAAIAMVQTRYDDARRACDGMQAQASALIVVACRAYADSLTGRAAQAAADLRQALAAEAVSPPERLWALTRLAEIDERRGDTAAADAAYSQALGLGVVDGYLLAARADFLLDHGRAAEVLALLQGRERSDLLLLRLALAAQVLKAPALANWKAELAARFAAARLRGDSVHEKEESRFVLALEADPARALELAQRNYRVQREPADARVLLEAALAARNPAAAQPVIDWMQHTGIESKALRALAARLAGGGR